MSTKLIRLEMDNVGEIPLGLDKSIITDPCLIDALLKAKLHEEAAEIAAAAEDTLLGELGDAYEVIYSIARLHGYTMMAVGEEARRKHTERGGFLKDLGGGKFGAMLQRDKS